MGGRVGVRGRAYKIGAIEETRVARKAMAEVASFLGLRWANS